MNSTSQHTDTPETPLHKSGLIQYVADSLLPTKSEAERAHAALVSAITTGVASGSRIAILGLGAFEARAWAAREASNPRSGETVHLAATTVPAVKPAATSKAAVAEIGKS